MARQPARHTPSGRGAPRTSMAPSARRAEADEALARQQRTQRLVLVLAVAVLVAFVVGMVLAFRAQGGDGTASTGTAPVSTSASTVVDPNQPPVTAAGPPVQVDAVAPGEQLAAPTPCPAFDGSAPRVTSFAEPPPLCIDPNRNYTLTMRTSVGDLVFFLNPKQGEAAINNFLVLAAYHYYDGLPLTKIDPLVDMQVDPQFTNPTGVTSPGYPVPLNAAVTIVNPGSLALLGTNDPGREAAGFKVALGQDAVGWTEDSPIIGLLLDGLEPLQAIREAGTPKTGEPTRVVTIEAMTIEPGGEAKTPPAGATP